MTHTSDPKAVAQQRFASADRCVSVIDVANRYATDVDEIGAILLDAAKPAAEAGRRICELGFGSGWLLEDLARSFSAARLYGLDMSRGMASHVWEILHSEVSLILGDMERLPFADTTFDVIFTCWTLYFMRDIDAALDETARCLAPGGRLVAVTNAPGHMAEFGLLTAQSLLPLDLKDAPPNISRRFDLESGGPLLRRHFREVVLREWRGEMVLPEIEPALALWEHLRPDSLSEDEYAVARAEFERLAREWLQRDGEMRIARHGGAFICSSPR